MLAGSCGIITAHRAGCFIFGNRYKKNLQHMYGGICISVHMLQVIEVAPAAGRRNVYQYPNVRISTGPISPDSCKGVSLFR